jgi:hypothetical protein
MTSAARSASLPWVAAVACIALAVAPPLALGGPAPRSASKFGVNDDAFGWTAQPTTALDLGWQAGFRWARMWIKWADVERGWDNDYHWEVIDGEIRALHQRGYSIVMSFVGVPSWANRWRATHGQLDNCSPDAFMPPDQGIPPDNDVYFADFVRQVVTLYGDMVAAVDLWNEPQACQFWRGDRAEWKDKILKPGFYAIKSARPDVMVGAPGVNIDHVGDFDGWFTYTDEAGRAVLNPDLDFVSFHHYGTVNQVKNSITSRAGFQRCNWNWSHCVSDIWVTEFGFSAGPCPWGGGSQSDPGWSAVEILRACKAQANCKRALIWDIWRPAHESCDYALLVGTPPVATDSKYGAIKSYISSLGCQ